MIRTLLVGGWILFSSLVGATMAIVGSFVKKGDDSAHLVARIWARSILLVSGVKVVVYGLENIDPCASYVYMANHQSMFDIFALLAFLPVRFRWLAKKELFSIPIFGYSMGRAGYISVDRSSMKAAYRSLQEAAQKIAQGVSVVIFPEGTRSSDGRIMPFKAGGFHLAITSGRPIVPVVIDGTHHIMPKGISRVRQGLVTISINPPIETNTYTRKTTAGLMEIVGATMRHDLERIRSAPAQGEGERAGQVKRGRDA